MRYIKPFMKNIYHLLSFVWAAEKRVRYNYNRVGGVEYFEKA